MYKFEPTGEPVEAAFRSIALSQLDEALGDLDKSDGDGRSVVHEARRRCKKIRGLLRLVRPAFPDFRQENAAIRDAAALLSHLRDVEVLQHTVADLAKWKKSALLEAIAARLGQTPDGDSGDKVSQFRQRMVEVRERAARWLLTRSGSDALMPGLRLTYRDGRRRLARAKDSGAAADFHEWRKASKYHGFHVDLLKRSAPAVLDGEIETIDKLSVLLGTHHDLVVLKDAIDHAPERFGDEANVAALHEAIAERKDEIEKDAFELGRQVFAERPRALARRFKRYWASAQ
jgi:hypothetical protein